MAAIEFKRGDACPRCGGAMAAVRVPTDAEFAKAFDREDPGTLPHDSDSMSPAQRKEFGDLYRCGSCGMDYRFASEASATGKKRSTA